MEIYGRKFQVEIKSDNSPVTEADLEVNRIVTEGLAKLTPDIPVLSEETDTPYELRKDYQEYWLMDPIDGTKEFVKRTGEFTINLGLVRNGVPVLGFIYIPVTAQMFIGGSFYGGSRLLYFYGEEKYPSETPNILAAKNSPLSLTLNRYDAPKEAIVLACSRSHRAPEDERVIMNLANKYFVNTFYSGSTIKVCKIAEGYVDAYVRLQGIYDWDLAAAHAIANGAGAYVYDKHGNPLIYNTEQQRLAPFIVSAPSLPQEIILSNLE